ncbi:MAG: transketolase [Oscillospiraceae bacterium]|nr:transketolase [Oscillospiraceae bacterium]
MSKENQIFAQKIRIEALKIFKHRGFGHIGGSMSVVETLAVLYNGVINVDPRDPNMVSRDRLVMSKGHSVVPLYAVLAMKGFFPLDDVKTLNQPGTKFPSHCDMNLTPGVDMSTGSLGQGVSCALGMALGQRMTGIDAKTYAIVGDGECNEGQVWETLMLAYHQKVSNLIIFCDRNAQQLDGYCKDILDVGDLADKFRAFGCFTQVVNGHCTDSIEEAVQATQEKNPEKLPSMIVLDTKKGYGCCFAEGQEMNHHYAANAEMMDSAITAAEKRLEEIRHG